MGQYSMKISVLPETKWFGSNVYHIASGVVFTLGRNLPPSNEPMQRNEGVALVLYGDAIFVVGRLQGNNGDHGVVGYGVSLF